jgi:hypothetical protein
MSIFPLLYFPPEATADPFWDDTILFLPLNNMEQYSCLRGSSAGPGYFANSYIGIIGGVECTQVWGGVPHSSLFNFANDDLTIECFVRISTLGIQQYIFSFYNVSSSADPWLRFFFFTNNVLFVDINDASNGYAFVGSGSFSFSVDTWYHVAVTRNVNTWTMWVDGTAQGTLTDSRTFPASSELKINIMNGANPSQSGLIRGLSGYIHDMRITKACRYTGTFTPPTVPLPTS